jgi:dephospho-CoA kinase
MIRVGLSGSRFAGKDRISKLFKQVGVPIFDADVVLKFILNYNYELLGRVKSEVGEVCFTNGLLDMKSILNNKLFDKVMDIIEPDLFNSYKRFEEVHKGSVYTIFNSSILFERDWQKKMDYNISVFTPKNQRISRAQFTTTQSITDLHKLANSEIDELVKNRLADFVIHNYESNSDVLDDVCKIDKMIIDDYLIKLRNEKKNKNEIAL